MTNIAEIRKMTPSLQLSHNHGAIIRVLETKMHHLKEVLQRHDAVADPTVPRAKVAQIMGATAASFDDFIQWATIQRDFSLSVRDLLEFEAAVAAEVEKHTR